jgi:lysophospholipase L1-like esterase
MSSFKLAAGLALSVLLCGSALAQAPAAPSTAAPAARPAPPPMPPATQPRERDDARHRTFVWQAQKGNIDLLFVGDSITDWWRTPGRGLTEFEKNFGQYRTANFGIAGDTTQGVLWRMRNGELDGFKAKLIVFMLGTNNIGRNTNADIAAGDRAIIEEFRKRQPQAKVLVLGVFPRGAAAGTPVRAAIAEINSHLAQVADNRNVFYMDIGPAFLEPDGTLPVEVMADGLHPTTKGYALWAAAINDKVRELMR